jgi:arginyl-tRNA synthetase
VFINSKGFPTYEGKDIGLAELHLKNHNPDAIYHVVGKDQTDYFKVVFQAIGEVFPELKGKEHHIIGGYVQLKGDQKMSSRLGNVVTGDQLIDVVEDGVREIMNERGATLDEETLKAIADSAYKYAMLKVGISDDISFDFESSISISGDSGPYLLYVIARINRLLAEQDIAGYTDIVAHMPEQLEQQERLLVVELAGCRAAVAKASEQQDPGAVAKYAYQLAQKFHQFYGACDMLRADEQTKQFRLQLSLLTKDVLTEVLDLLAITPVEEI